MLDAVGKPGVGLLNGNINWVGGYKECKQTIGPVNAEGKPLFTGKYCRSSLSIPKSLIPVR